MTATEKAVQHIGETQGIANHDHDMVHELSKKLDALWRYDQYIANAESRDNLKQFWTDVKSQEQENIRRLKQLIAEEIQSNCF